MPSPIAHAVTGYCLGNLGWAGAAPGTLPQRRLTVGLAVFAAIAADLDFLPQILADVSAHRGVSHSVGMALAGSLILALWFLRRSRRQFYAVAGLALAAYGSHLLLDLFTTGGRGLPLLWPLSPTLIQVPLTLFPQVHHSEGLFYSGHIPVVLFEVAYGGLLLWLTAIAASRLSRRRLPSGPTVGDRLPTATAPDSGRPPVHD